MKDVFTSSGPKAGDVLVASHEMAENLFSRTLVLLQSFSTEGALGFILNRPLGEGVQRNASTSLPKALQDVPMFFGGPVQSHHMVIMHFLAQPNHTFSCSPIEDLASESNESSEAPPIRRAYMGYAGWSSGQLDQEIERGDWTWVPSDTIYLKETFGDSPWELAASADHRWQTFREQLPDQPETN